MQMSYVGMERMDRAQRKLMFKAVKQARIQMDFDYPMGKPEILKPTDKQTKEVKDGIITTSKAGNQPVQSNPIITKSR